MPYKFDAQLQQGHAGEEAIYQWLSRFYTIHRCTDMAQQRQGVDAIIRHKDSGNQFLVEVKTDYRAAETGNAFVELVAYDKPTLKLGWAYTCQSDWLIYFLPVSGQIFFLKPRRIRDRLNFWLSRYKQRTVPNQDFNTRGLLVPLQELQDIAAIATTIDTEKATFAASPH
jgi:hypothetical protein